MMNENNDTLKHISESTLGTVSAIRFSKVVRSTWPSGESLLEETSRIEHEVSRLDDNTGIHVKSLARLAQTAHDGIKTSSKTRLNA